MSLIQRWRTKIYMPCAITIQFQDYKLYSSLYKGTLGKKILARGFRLDWLRGQDFARAKALPAPSL